MTRRALLVSAAVAISVVPASPLSQPLPVVSPEKVGLSAERLSRVGRAIEDEIARGSTPGAVVLVARRGKIAYFESFGFTDKSRGVPMRKDAIFRIYSMTKPIVSVAAMTLVEEGKLQLTDPVSRWVPELKGMKVARPRSDATTGEGASAGTVDREMTVHDLLRHTSGLGYADPIYGASAAVLESYARAGVGKSAEDLAVAPAEWTRRLSGVVLAHEPGTAWMYGVSTDVLGRVLEAVTGKRLGEVVAERVLRPLGMSDSGFFVPAEKHGRLAQPLEKDPTSGKPITLLDVASPPANELGGAGMVSTAHDYLRFCQMLLDGGRLGGARLISRTTVSWMTADHLGDKIPALVGPGELVPGRTGGYGFGLGFAVRRASGVAGVPGSAGEFSWAGFGGTYFWVDPAEQLVAIYMSQTPGAGRLPTRRVLKQLVTQAIVD
jgi:CubicO group peptidase (beta-lactamase class C family)